MNLPTIFFDLDKTLWDFEANSEITLKELYKDFQILEIYGLPFSNFHDTYFEINERYWEEFRDGKITKEELLNNRFKKAFSKHGIHNDAIANEFRNHYLNNLTTNSILVNGAEELLKNLTKKGYDIHVITNGFKKVSERKIKNSGLKKYIKTITSSDDVGVRKPDPKIFEHAFEISGAQADISVIIGDDWIADIEGGLALGMETIFLDRLNENPKISKNQNVKVIKHLSEIKQYF